MFHYIEHKVLLDYQEYLSVHCKFNFFSFTQCIRNVNLKSVVI